LNYINITLCCKSGRKRGREVEEDPLVDFTDCVIFLSWKLRKKLDILRENLAKEFTKV
jgi:hypothetical protein